VALTTGAPVVGAAAGGCRRALVTCGDVVKPLVAAWQLDAPGVGRAPSLQANGNLVDHSMAMGATTASQRAVAKAAQDFLEDLTVRMRRMDKPPQSTFRHSYGGEFEVRLRLLLEPLGVLCGCLFDRAAALLGAV